MNIYAVVSIGNTDNQLTQQQWHDFVDAVAVVVKSYGKIHFFGGASNWEPWQNVAWIVECPTITEVLGMSDGVSVARKKYNQSSAFILRGAGEFV